MDYSCVWFISELTALKNIELGPHFVWKYFPWINNRFMLVVHKIPHAILEVREGWFFWSIIYPIKRMVRYLRSLRIWTTMYIRPPNQWFSDSPWCFSIIFRLSPISGVATNISFSNYMSIVKGDIWKLNSSFVLPPQYDWIILLVMWFSFSISNRGKKMEHRASYIQLSGW